MRYILIIAALFCSLPQISAQNNIAYGAGISYTNGAPSFTPPARTSRVAIDTITGKWYHYNTPGGWQLLGNTIEEIAGCSAPAYTPTKGDSKVVINNCTNPELYYWTGSAWVWINEGTTYYAGKGIRIQNDSIILDSLYTLRFRTGSATDGEAGRLTWDANEGTIDVVLNAGSVTGQMFEHVFFNCHNQTGTTITRGTVVMAVGALGASGRILIAPAIADGSVNSEYILGTAAMDISNGSDGLVYHFGKDRGLNTTGASCGETWADNDVLYCSATTPGCLTKVLPTAPNLKVPIAIVLNAGNNGTIFVRPSHFPDLNQINDVQLTSPTTGQTLIYNSVTGVWSNQTPADPSSTNELQTLSTGTNTLTLSNGGGTVTVDTDPSSDLTGNGVAGYLPQYNTSSTLDTSGVFWNATTGSLGIGTASPSATLSVSGRINQINIGNSVFLGIGAGQNDDLSNNYNTFIGRDAGFTNTTGAFNTFIGYNAGKANTTAISNVMIGASAGEKNTATNNLFVGTSAGANNTTGLNNTFLGRNAGFNNITGSYNLFIGSGSGYVNTNSYNIFIGVDAGYFNSSGRLNLFTGYRAGYSNTTGEYNFFLGSDAGSNNKTGSSNVLIGVDAGRYVGLTGTTIDTLINNSILIGQDARNLGTNQTNQIVIAKGGRGLGSNTTVLGNSTTNQTWLGGSLTLGTQVAPAARLHVVGSGSTSTTWTAQFHNSAGNNNALMVRNDGIVSIGTASPNGSGALEINSTTQGVLFPRMTTTQRNAITTPADGLVIYNTTDNKLQVRASGVWVDLH
jgi:hypothetical protein